MRYLGSKEKLIDQIKLILSDKSLDKNNLIFFDAFCGMGSVANSVKDTYKVIINDILRCSVTYTTARLVASKCTFSNLNVDPFEYFNNTSSIVKGVMYTHYSPGGSERMYFSAENAGRIDFFRKEIETWYQNKLINGDEHSYLLGCLLESVSKISNTAGVYGAFLKHWDSRALKPIVFERISQEGFCNNVDVYNNKIEDIISDIECDILYLDPPYTQNQYGTQYHLLETIIVNDTPEMSKITGSRPTKEMRSDWSKMYKSHILFDKLIAETKAKYIIFSYNVDGFMSKDYIEATLKRYGNVESYECRVIDYQKYNNFKCQGSKGHCEYLFYIEKKDSSEVVYESPLNYTGSKVGMMNEIKNNIPNDISKFIDAFGGGYNVGVNINSGEMVYNEINDYVHSLLKSFCTIDTYSYLLYINKLIKQYDLSPSNKEGYLKLRELYNSISIPNRDPRMLYTLILHGFQQQIRFNNSHNFNNPSGSRYFNDKLLSKFISFTRICRAKNTTYINGNYIELTPHIDNKVFVYCDPPYSNTLGVYNDGKRGFNGWTLENEAQLCMFLQDVDKVGAKFMLSYNDNEDIIKWANSNKYNVISVETTQGRYNNRQEILVKNY